ncbi:c-type cytochrome biogenesis protein CcsB [Rhodococcus sp. X156]|uniref:c-type cytochrome biogenesis protein CcsB n=1 Tax=Rhodococcus sp. X156 TaxID=2499145 RepID=UPI000FDABFA6|nr:c-type cytochrome biogenesis protein CcsB [Rhodococcus sp. X156]
MPIDPDLSRYSDLAFGSSIAVYILALVFVLVDFAGSRNGVLQSRAAGSRTREKALVGAGSTPTGPGRVEAAPTRPVSERFGRMGVALVALGMLLNVASLVLRGMAASRAPWGNMYEFVSLMCAIAVAAWLVVIRKPGMRQLTVFLLAPVILLMFLAGTVLYARTAPVVPALRSYWLVIHVSVITASTAVMMVSGVASLLFLLRRRHPAGSEGSSALGRLALRMPTDAALDRVAYRTAIFGFPLFTAGVILGAIWAEAAWGRFWGWDPKETTAFIAWVLYAAYLHARATAGWRNTRAAWINIAGLAVMMFNLFFINMVVSGLHSYAGLN